MTLNKKQNPDRRNFIRKAASTAALGATGILASCAPKEVRNEGPNINFNNKYKWKMVTTWPPNFPVLGEACGLFAQWVNEMSGGRMEIEVYGGGELIPPLECFDAVSNGAVEMGNGAAYYWAGKIPASQFFASVPFGMNAQQMNAWIINGGGNDLWNEIYQPFNLLALPAGNTGIQAGGWYNREINTLEDIKGLKMRMPGLGGKILTRAGGSSVLVAGGELFTNLERGVIDATEWIGPYHDYLMGFHKVAKYYYYPGWHEPGTIMEMLINREKYEKLPKDLQQIIKAASYQANHWVLSEFETKNSIYLLKLKEESKVSIRPYPDEVLQKLKVICDEVIQELTDSDPTSKRVYEHYNAFKSSIADWSSISERTFYEKF